MVKRYIAIFSAYLIVCSLMEGLPLKCDCHIQWLHDFIKNRPNNNTVKDATCDDGILLKNANNFTQCLGT